MSIALGARLGPYEVVEPLGKGGMGEVYRARDSRLGRDVAIKVLPSHTASSRDALARFELEARAVASLNHPNILALYDVGIEAGVSYAVTELLEGETLRDRLAREGALPPRKAFDMAVPVLRKGRDGSSSLQGIRRPSSQRKRDGQELRVWFQTHLSIASAVRSMSSSRVE
jgi:eukaryotic-like serine/threonine-protein kinase